MIVSRRPYGSYASGDRFGNGERIAAARRHRRRVLELAGRPGGVTVPELLDLGYAEGSARQYVSVLVDLGYVEVRKNDAKGEGVRPSGRKRDRVTITEAGRAAFERGYGEGRPPS